MIRFRIIPRDLTSPGAPRMRTSPEDWEIKIVLFLFIVGNSRCSVLVCCFGRMVLVRFVEVYSVLAHRESAAMVCAP